MKAQRIIRGWILISATVMSLFGGCSDNDCPFPTCPTCPPANTPPTANFSYEIDKRDVQFTDKSADSAGCIMMWSWTFGDGATSNEQHPVHHYDSVGDYKVMLVVTDNSDSTDSCTHEVTIENTLPHTAFLHNKIVGECTIKFTDESSDEDGSIVYWHWQFGDDYSSHSQHPRHEYNDCRVYEVTLNILDNDSGFSACTTLVDVANEAPVADFAYDDSCQIVRFTDQSRDTNGYIVTWYWQFGDGSSSFDQFPIYEYDNYDIYEVVLTVMDNHGASDMDYNSVPIENEPPVAIFGYEINGQTVEFRDSSFDSCDDVISWQWDFGDGSPSILQHPVHSYENAGLYKVVLTVTDDFGATQDYMETILVDNLSPDCRFSVSDRECRLIAFNDESTDDDGSIVSWYWRFGDDSISLDEDPEHKYVDLGNYEVVLTVMDNEGATSSCTSMVVIENELPVAAFLNDVNGRYVQFYDESSDCDGDVIGWQWNFGDGDISNERNPSHDYDSIRQYVVTLTVLDDDGGSDSYTETVITQPLKPVACFTYDTVGSIVMFADCSWASDGEISVWHWDFGDGDTSAMKDPSHEYEVAGDYNVILTVIDNMGTSDADTQTISLIHDYIVYSDLGIPLKGEVYTWDGSDHGGPEATFDGEHECDNPPEGAKCFLTTSGSNWEDWWDPHDNYAGWGVFKTKPNNHKTDLSAYNTLRFWVKSFEDLLIEIQLDYDGEVKCSVNLSDHGWDGTETWQQISIPAVDFCDFGRLHGVFLITVEQGDRTFYVDNVRWVK